MSAMRSSLVFKGTGVGGALVGVGGFGVALGTDVAVGGSVGHGVRVLVGTRVAEGAGVGAGGSSQLNGVRDWKRT
jgi:hypothetical protein